MQGGGFGQTHFNIGDAETPAGAAEDVSTYEPSGFALYTAIHESACCCLSGMGTYTVWTQFGSFVGMTLPASGGLLDTGAQHGVVGKPHLERLEKELEQHGLKVRRVPMSLHGASGVGGSTEFMECIEVPIGLGGVSGTVTLHVTAHDTPLLLPQGLNKRLGMILDMSNETAEWKYI